MSESLIILAIVVVGTVVFLALIFIGRREDEGRDPLQERLAQFGDKEMPQSLEEIELTLSFRDRVILPLLKSFARISTRFTPQKQLEETRHQI